MFFVGTSEIFLLLTLYQITILASSSSTPPQANTHHQCLDHQKSAAQENFLGYFSLEGELWDLKTECYSWEGVWCNGVGHVTKLDLSPLVYQTQQLISRPNLEMLFQNLSFLVELNLDCVDMSAHSSSWCEAISHALPNLKECWVWLTLLFLVVFVPLSWVCFLCELHLDGISLSSIAPNLLVNSST